MHARLSNLRVWHSMHKCHVVQHCKMASYIYTVLKPSMTVNGRLTEDNEPSSCCCAGTHRCMRGIMMRAGSLACGWQMCQQYSCYVVCRQPQTCYVYRQARSFSNILHPLWGVIRTGFGQGWSLDEGVAPPPEGMSLDTPPARIATPSPLAIIPNGHWPMLWG